MTEHRKQCVQCGAHTFRSVCSVCRSMHLELIDDQEPRQPTRRFGRRPDPDARRGLLPSRKTCRSGYAEKMNG